MDAQAPSLEFPTAFCCNCGDTNCESQVQDTRITRFFGLGGTETTFHLALPVCAACRRTLRRRPAGLFSRLLVFVLATLGAWLSLFALARVVVLPQWMQDHTLWISAGLGLIVTVAFYRLRRPRPPRTSFYQPVRIKSADVRFAGVMGGPGEVVHMKLAFTNPDYLNVFMHANGEAIRSGRVAVTQA